MLKELSWFEDRVGFDVLRGTTVINIESFEMARALFELQDDRYSFTDKIRVHRAPLAECESCSA